MKIFKQSYYDKIFKKDEQVNKSDAALLQARHFYNNAKVESVIDGGGFTMGSDTLIINVNRLAWGYFEQTILKAFQERNDLRNRNPELVKEETACVKCNGVGGFPYILGTKEYDEAYDMFFKFDGKLDEDASPYGVALSRFCSECQGTGLTLKNQPNKV